MVIIFGEYAVFFIAFIKKKPDPGIHQISPKRKKNILKSSLPFLEA
jgi:hypothetical protein